MLEPPLPADEAFRLAALNAMNILDTPIEERFERITRLARRVFGTPIAAVSFVDGRRQWFKSIQGLTACETSRAVSFCGHTILDEEMLVVPDAREDPRFADNPLVIDAPNVVFYAGCPLRAPDGSAVGALCVIDHEPRSFTHEDSVSLRDLAALVESELTAGAMGSLLDEEKRQARIDPLTRLWNRAGIFSLLENGRQRSAREAGSFAVIMADVDRFKEVNDRHGHPAGDEVLRQASRRMLGALRDVDAVGRYGGDEFLIVLGTCRGPDEATTVAERLRRRVGEAPVTWEGGQVQVTLSLGIAYATAGEAVSTDGIVASADAALYRAKSSGRNRVELQVIDAGGLPVPPEMHRRPA